MTTKRSTHRAIAAGVAVALAMPVIAAWPVDADAAGFTMKIGTPTINDTQHEWMKRFQKRINGKAGKRVKVELYPSSQLGKIPRMIEGMQLGTIEGFIAPSAFLVGVDQRNMVLTAPGLFKDINHCWRTVMDDRFRKAYFPMMEGKGIVTISIMCTAPQAFLTKRDVKKLDDIKGLKIRVLASDLEIKPLQAVGINPTPMAFSEVLPALQRNVIDGLSSIPILFNNMKMYNAAKHITATGLVNWAVPVYASKVWWDKLPADLRGLMLAEGKAIERELIEWNEKANARTMDSWKKNGGTVGKLPAADQAKLVSTIKPVVKKVIAGKPAVNKLFLQVSAIADSLAR